MGNYHEINLATGDTEWIRGSFQIHRRGRLVLYRLQGFPDQVFMLDLQLLEMQHYGMIQQEDFIH
jgi:hypothetical protein